MIKYLSNKAATYIAQNDKTADPEILEYGFELLFQEIAVFIAATLIALPFGVPLQVLLTFAAYNIMRASAGGAHASSRLVCFFISVLVIFGPSLLFVRYGVQIPLPVMLGMFAADLLVLLRYAPGDTEIKPLQTPEKRKRYKIRTIVMTLLYFGIAFALRNDSPSYAGIFASIPTMLAVFNLPFIYWVLGCKRSTPEIQTIQ